MEVLRGLREWREQQGWSRQHLADVLSVDLSTIKRWERGQSEPYPIHLDALRNLGFPPGSSREENQGEGAHAMAEQASTYFVEDRSDQREMQRLIAQDTLFTNAMGGVLAEQSHPENFQRILDVGCGAGGWLIETAKTYPTISQLIGVDISKTMLDYARAQAVAGGVSSRVEFLVMDALRMLEFPTGYFDLVNMRLAMSFLRTWDWPKLLQEFRRVLRPGGMVRITETLLQGSGTENTIILQGMFRDALTRAGHTFPDGFAVALPALLEQFGFRDINQKRYEPIYTHGSHEGRLFIEDVTYIFRTALPFLRKWTTVPTNYDEIYQRMLEEMALPDFKGIWPIMTVWGTMSSA